MKSKFKLSALILSMLMVVSSSMVSFAAEASQPNEIQSSTDEIQSIPIVVDNDAIAPIKGGTEVSFAIGKEAYIDNCGYVPTFEMWVTGGSYDTKVNFYLTAADGQLFGPCGPVPADGSQGYRFRHIVGENKGAWKFVASVVGDASTAGLVCHVKQL